MRSRQRTVDIFTWPLRARQKRIIGTGGWIWLVRRANKGAGAGGPHLPPLPSPPRPGIASAMGGGGPVTHPLVRVRRMEKGKGSGRRRRRMRGGGGVREPEDLGRRPSHAFSAPCLPSIPAPFRRNPGLPDHPSSPRRVADCTATETKMTNGAGLVGKGGGDRGAVGAPRCSPAPGPFTPPHPLSPRSQTHFAASLSEVIRRLRGGCGPQFAETRSLTAPPQPIPDRRPGPARPR